MINTLPYIVALLHTFLIGGLSYFAILENQKRLQLGKKYETPFGKLALLLIVTIAIVFCMVYVKNSEILPKIGSIEQLVLIILSYTLIFCSQKVSSINTKILPATLLFFVGLNLIMFSITSMTGGSIFYYLPFMLSLSALINLKKPI
jgi:hypothetical protein